MRIALSLIRVESGYDCISALNFIDVSYLQIHPMSHLVSGVCKFLINLSV